MQELFHARDESAGIVPLRRLTAEAARDLVETAARRSVSAMMVSALCDGGMCPALRSLEAAVGHLRTHLDASRGRQPGMSPATLAALRLLKDARSSGDVCDRALRLGAGGGAGSAPCPAASGATAAAQALLELSRKLTLSRGGRG